MKVLSAKEATLSAMSEIGSNYLDYTCNVSGIYSCIFLSGPAGSLPTVCSNFGHCYDFGR
jgi:hypothetical protein